MPFKRGRRFKWNCALITDNHLLRATFRKRRRKALREGQSQLTGGARPSPPPGWVDLSGSGLSYKLSQHQLTNSSDFLLDEDDDPLSEAEQGYGTNTMIDSSCL